jgi:uncharacterized protein (TIGR03905 family)
MNSYTPRGVCSKLINFTIEGNIVRNVSFYSGCPGNLQGISKLVEGMDIYEVINRLKGITCGGKSTSCPDQLSKALEEYIKENSSNEEIA